ncbi:hypothetical protein AB8O38_18705 [Saccharomonospora xinjiangensis]|uniref:hypothetical protein n=1 Tax=Saccharomonospora xinjiangensis TaxID=75294 RepID=UPI00350FA8BC
MTLIANGVTGHAAPALVDEDTRTGLAGTSAPSGSVIPYVADVYATLRMNLTADIAHRIACLDGAPVRAEHDRTRCRYCGVPVAAHDIPGDPGDPPTYRTPM